MSVSSKIIGKVRKVLTYPHPVLKQKCEIVQNIAAPNTQQIIADLITTVQHANGLGLSAPQIGESQRIFVVRTPIATTEQQMKRLSKYTREMWARQPPSFSVLINPVILSKDEDNSIPKDTTKNRPGSTSFVSYRKRSSNNTSSSSSMHQQQRTATAVGYEACLSLPDFPALVRRYTGIQVKYQTETGKVIDNQRLENLPAIVFQHEYDHLDGILINDVALSPETAGASFSGQTLGSTNTYLSRASYDEALDQAMRRFSVGLIKYYNDNGELDRSELQNGKDTVVHLDDDIKS